MIKNKTMKNNLINSTWMKNRLFEYFRYKRQFIYCCTEGINYSDFMALNEDHLIEVEVKISKSDLLNEFKKEYANNGKNYCKVQKHFKEYCNAQEFLSRKEFISEKNFFMDIPNYFYLAVTEDLLDVTKEQIKKVNDNYGIILIQTKEYNKGEVMIAKTAKKLHDYKPNFKTFYYIGRRTTSELATLRSKYLEEKIMFENIKCKNYPNPCHHVNDLDSIYEHGVCLDCTFIPDEVIDYYKNIGLKTKFEKIKPKQSKNEN